jgi:hypothetical protein
MTTASAIRSRLIEVSARTGSMGDRRLFISPVEAACTVRTGEPDYDRSTESIAKKIIMLKSQYGRANARAVATGRHAGSPSATACRATCLVGLLIRRAGSPHPDILIVCVIYKVFRWLGRRRANTPRGSFSNLQNNHIRFN